MKKTTWNKISSKAQIKDSYSINNNLFHNKEAIVDIMSIFFGDKFEKETKLQPINSHVSLWK